MVCKELIPEAHIRVEGASRRLGAQLMAAAADTEGAAVFESGQDW